MKISIFTTITNPVARRDMWAEALISYNFADEIIIVNGGVELVNVPSPENKYKGVVNPWPKEFSWEFIGQQFQRGYEAATGDWVIHADLDFVFHEDDYAAIRQAFENNPEAPALSFWKYQFISPNKYSLKSRLVIAVNKGKYGDRIRFDSGGDLCQPSLDGVELRPDQVPEARIPFYNYEKVLKTEAQIKDDVGRMARAWQRHFGEYKLGGPDDESAYKEWLKMTVGRYQKPQEEVSLSFHPKVMHDTLRNLRPDQFGFNGFGALQNCKYIDTLN